MWKLFSAIFVVCCLIGCGAYNSYIRSTCVPETYFFPYDGNSHNVWCSHQYHELETTFESGGTVMRCTCK
jgi:hypothetical protein